MTVTQASHNPVINLLLALRPNQWTKNGVLLAALFFGYWDKSQQIELLPSLSLIIPGVLLFCLASSSVYLVNDVRDVASDRAHPTKRFRPIAAGRVSIRAALIAAAALFLLVAVGAWLLDLGFFAVVMSYLALQLVYSFLLKKVALVDVFVIASGFVLRAIAGAVAINVTISPWLLLCTFLLALFLGLCKRRHEKIVLGDLGSDLDQRASLGKYDTQLLNQLIAIVSSATIVSYALYTLWPETVEKFGTSMLGFTIPFVMFGVFRYLDLVYRHEKGDRPEKILLTDIPLLTTIFLYGITVISIFLIQTRMP
jgi:4-hydroxybenzoate polyprenyltransferase